MRKGYIFPFIVLILLMPSMVTVSPPVPSPAQVKSKVFDVPKHLNSPVGLLALESFTGGDGKGKDGVMAKMGLDLALIFQEHRDYKMKGGASVLGKEFTSSRKKARIQNEKVVVDFVADGDVDTLVQELSVLGLEDISVYGRMVSGLMPIASLEQSASVATMRFSRIAYARTRTGSVTGQGDAALLADDARTSFSVDGTGVVIGTLSDSYDCLVGAAGDVASNDLPSGIIVLEEETGCVSGSDEGRAMMQIVHDIAPGSIQLFHSAFNGEASFATGITKLAEAGADIINDDVIYLAEPMFQDGIIAQAVDTVKATGVSYFSSAGNSGSNSYESIYVSSGVAGTSGTIRHDFDPSAGTDDLMEVSIPGNAEVTFVLQWQDPFFSVSGAPGAATDMDMVLYSSEGVAQAGSFSLNVGGDAVEIFSFTNPDEFTQTYQLGIEYYSGATPSKVKFVYYGNMTINEYATNSATSYGHSNAAGARSVGAARYDATPDFGVSPPILESFSSRGGIDILFDTSGNTVSEVRLKPEIVAPDGGDTTFFGSDYESNGFPNFFGTSAAAPHAAGLAALLKEFDNTLTPDTLYSAMQTTAIDMDVTGFDDLTGYGLIQATSALASLDADGDMVPDSQDNCPNDANTTQDNFDGDSLGDACDPDDDNDGLSDVDEVTYGTNQFLADSDGDNLSDGDEVNTYGTNPALADSDLDGINDDVEILAGTDPNGLSSPGPSIPVLSWWGLIFLSFLMSVVGRIFLPLSIDRNF